MKELTDKEKIEFLKSFAFDVIKEFGNVPSKTTYLTINDMAVKHGLGKKELRKKTLFYRLQVRLIYGRK